MRIGLDFDGVIADASQLKSEGVKRLYGLDIPPGQCKKELVINAGLLTDEQYRQLQKAIYETREFGFLMNPVDGVLEYLPKLISQGHDIVVITSRGTNEIAIAIAQEWCASYGLELNFIGVDYRDTKANAAAGLDVYIDDDFDKLEPLVGLVPNLFLMSWDYNKHIDAGALARRVSSWKQFYQITQKLGRVK